MTPEEYKSHILATLDKHNLRFGTEISNLDLNTDYSFEYHRWLHPSQSEWELVFLFTKKYLDSLKALIPPQSTVLDIGAHTGNMSVAYSLFASKVLAFEPNPAAFEVLEKNASLHPSIEPVYRACSTNTGVETFHYSDLALCNGGFATSLAKGIGSTGHTVPLDVFRVDTLQFLEEHYSDYLNNISFIKIDAEGHDASIIRNLAPLIQRNKPTILTELYTDLEDSEQLELFDILLDLDYDIYNEPKQALDTAYLGPRIISSPQGRSLISGENLFCQPKSINNDS